MAAKFGFIRKGDKTSCGGTVAGGDPTLDIHGRELATVGTPVSCAMGCKITQGWPSHLADRKPVGYDGCLTTQGCRCQSSLNGIAGFDG